MKNLIKNFAKDETGANAIEYGLIAAIISIALVIALPAVRANLQGLFNRISGCLGSQGGAC